VFLTMLLTAIAVIYISTPESRQFYEQGLSQAYTVFDTGNIDGTNTDSNSVKFAKSLVNALVIVSVICGMTFVVVLLYKYNCVKCLWAYMILANIVLLGFLSGTMFQVAIDRYQLYVDKISFYWFLYNLAFVGVLAIFASTKGGVPSYITQAYLILCSVIVAWQLSNFDNWTAWSLLVFLALYDLFAVLSPCGPLKALVKLMMKEDAPEMPGLLYEANINRPPPTDSSNPMNISNNGNENIVINDTAVATSTAINTSTTGDATGEGFGSTTTAQQTRSSDLRSTHVKSTEPTQTQSRTDLFQHNNDNHNDATSDDGSGLLLLLSTSSDSTAFSGPSLTDVSSMSSTSNHREYDRTLPIKTAIEETITGRSTKRRVEVVIENPYLAPRNYDEDEDEADGHDADVESGNDNESPMTSPFGSETDARQQSHRLSVETSADENTQRRTASVPYALAKLYRLPTVHEPQPPWIISQRQSDSRKVLRPAQIIREEVKDEGSVVSTSYIDPNYDTTTSASAANISVSTNNNNDIDDTSVATVIFTAEQLTAMIDVVFPRNGGHIRKAEQQIAGQEVRWEIVDGNSNVKRILFVKSDTGKVYEDFGHMNNNNEPQRQRRQSNISERNSIRLGLGDFIFYSVLVSKAALYSFPTLVTAIVAIITGLGLTLLLLGISGKALPALPISIALGVSFFFQTKFVTEPWLNQILFVNQNGTMYV
jgi:Presenilin